MEKKMNIMENKRHFFYISALLLILVEYISSFCQNPQKLTNLFPNNLDSEIFYLKKVTKKENDDIFIVGTEKQATVSKLPNLIDNNYVYNFIRKMDPQYSAYADSFGNIDPIIVGASTLEEIYSIKYILTEGTTVENEFSHALYDVKLDEIREGKLSFGFDDFKILESLNEKEYIGAVKIYDANKNIYSIKLQIMSFTQKSNGYIKQLSGKEYAETSYAEQTVNNIYFIDSLKKILIIRTINNQIYFDFIDYDNYFGTIQISKMITAPFNVTEYRFYSIVLSKEEKKTYIASCFKKLKFLYCYSGYYDEEKVDFILLQESPKLMLSKCADKIYKNVALYKLNSGIGIIGCSGNPYYTVRFDKNLDTIGTPIKFPKPYTEFLVVNSSSLFVIYTEIDESIPGNTKYDLNGCIYHLPICTNQKFFINKDENFDFKLIKNNDELQNINDIYIIKALPDNGNFYTMSGTTESPISSFDSSIISIDNLYYKNNRPSSSFEEKIYYNTIVEKSSSITDDEDAKSQECILSIINCYESCKKCDDIGDNINNNCLECYSKTDISPPIYYRFIEDESSKQCHDESVTLNNYFLDGNYFKRCYSSCETCKKGKDSNHHNCLTCDSNYYLFYQYTLGSDTLKDCYLDTQPPEDFYFDKDETADNKFKPCSDFVSDKCSKCIKITVGSIFCKRCKTNDGFYAYFEDDEKTNAECRNTVPDGPYFLDEKAGEYKKCYPSCASCSRSGSDEFNNCDTCKADLEIYKYSIDSSTCKCKYNFYYKIDSDTNKKEFTCTDNQKCPNEEDNKYPYLMINSQNIGQCVSECPEDSPYKYNYQCYNHIPNGTSLVHDSSYECADDNVNYDQCIINDYIKSSVPLTEISKVENDYVNHYRNQYTNTGNNDYTYNHANMVRNNNEEYLLLIFQNEKCVEKITSEYGLGYTDLTDYSSKIKSENGIDQKEPLIYSYLYTYVDPNGNETPIENLTYNVFNSDTGEKLNLDDVLEGENITRYAPAPSGSDLQKLNYLSKYSDLGVDFSDPNSDFFNSQCFIFTSDSGKDVTLADRRKYFFNNIKICEEDCVFNGIDNKTNTAKCSCPYKSSKSNGGKKVIKNITFPDYKEDYFIFDMWKCLSKKMVKGKELQKSYIAIIVFCILLLTILFTVLYFCCFKNKFQFISEISNKYRSISSSSQSVSQKNASSNQKKSNPPPKNEGDEDDDSNLKKEKGYVHDVKRPFNYDNNNLFFHADEHYTIGNQNLNSLFMGQNFKNDYTENMEQLNNNEKKPKPVINNYNNVNIPGKRINKSNTKKPKKINNFNNINIGPDIVTINNSNPDNSINKDKVTRNGPLIIKNDSDADSVDPFRKEKVSIKPNNFINKNKKIKPDESSDKSYTNYSKSLLSNRNNSINGKIPDNKKDDEFNNEMNNICKEMGEENMKINKADYNTASQKDFRDFCSFYFNQLKHRQIFFYSTYFHKYAENIFMKIMVIIFHILLCLFLNLFWYRTSYVHSEFISPITNHSTFSSKNAWFRILLSVLFYIIIVCLLHLIYLPQLKIYYSLSDDKIDKNTKLQIMEKNIKCMKINYIIFIVINFCFLIVLILYTLVFSYVFRNSKTDLMISFILTVIITQALPFVFVFFVTVFRFIGLKKNCPCAYNFSLFFTI